jgi:ATP-dependent Clp protease ATP-binding subunit ClpC
MIRELKDRLKNKEIDIEITDKAKMKLIDEGYDEEFGARPLRRAIQRLVENKLSEHILSGEINEGDKVKVDKKQDKLVFNKEE